MATVIKLRSRLLRSGCSHTSPNSTSSRSCPSLGMNSYTVGFFWAMCRSPGAFLSKCTWAMSPTSYRPARLRRLIPPAHPYVESPSPPSPSPAYTSSPSRGTSVMPGRGTIRCPSHQIGILQQRHLELTTDRGAPGVVRRRQRVMADALVQSTEPELAARRQGKHSKVLGERERLSIPRLSFRPVRGLDA